MAEKQELVEMLIRFYNFNKCTKYKVTNENNQKVVEEAIDRANGDIADLKEHIRRSNSEDGIIRTFDSYIGKLDTTIPTVSVNTEQTKQESSNTGKYMGLLEKAVVELVAQTNAKELEDRIFNSIEDKVKDFIKNEYGIIERKVTTVVDGKKVEMEGVTHEKFETVLKFVSNNEPVFLTGPAGSGKNMLCQQVAKALGLDFYFTNAVTQEYKLTGFTDAMGVFHESQFYKAFKNGGLFMLDEMDASIPEVLIILNSAIANKYFDFPAPIGYVEAHPNFRVISAGNTFGTGADYEYVGRNQLDMASLDRFAMVRIDYSEAIENNVTCGNGDLTIFARDYRTASSKAGVKTILSYRALGRIAKMEQLLPIEEVLQTCLTKGMQKDDIQMILTEMKTQNNKYTKALKLLKEGMNE